MSLKKFRGCNICHLNTKHTEWEGIAAKAILLLDCVNNQVMSNMNLRFLRHLCRSHMHMANNNSYTIIAQPYFECCAQLYSLHLKVVH